MAAGAPQTSIVIPTYNRSRFAHRAVSSALAQTAGDIEVIVVDDGSEDETESVLANLGDQRIRYLKHAANRGPAAAWLTGIANAIGEFIAFLPADDVYLPNFLSAHLHAFDDDIAVVFSRYLVQRENGETVSVVNGDLRKRAVLTPPALLQASLGSRIFLAAALYRRSAIQNLPDEVVTAGTALDYAINVEIALRGSRGLFIPVEEFVYTDHPAQARHTNSAERSFSARDRYLRQALHDRRTDRETRRLIRRERSNWSVVHARRSLAEGDRRSAAKRLVNGVCADPTNPWSWKQLLRLALPTNPRIS